MDVFVTGATGVLGRPTTRLLIERGHRVRGLVRSEHNERALRALGVEPVRADLFATASLREAMRDPDAVLHLATHIPPTGRMRRRSAWHENDRLRREGTRCLVEAALLGRTAVLVYPSVTLVYPDSGAAWIDAATTSPAPVSFLGSTVEAEAEVARFAHKGRRGVTLRLGALYGADSSQTHEVLDYARRGIAAVPGPGDAYQSSIWVDDAARAIVAAMEDVPSGTYDVVDDEPLRRDELAAAVGRTRLRRIPGFITRVFVGSDVAEVNSRSQRVSNRRFKQATAWVPRVPSAHQGWQRLGTSAVDELSERSVSHSSVVASRGLRRPGSARRKN